MNIKCPACKRDIGDTDYSDVNYISGYHAPHCKATEAEREAARNDLVRQRFEALTKNLSL